METPSNTKGLSGSVSLLHSLQLKLVLPVLVVLSTLIFFQARVIAQRGQEAFLRQSQEALLLASYRLVNTTYQTFVGVEHDCNEISQVMGRVISLAGIAGERRGYALLNTEGKVLAVGGVWRDVDLSDPSTVRRELPDIGRTDLPVTEVSTGFSWENDQWLAALSPIPTQASCARCHDGDVPVRGWMLAGLPQAQLQSHRFAIRNMAVLNALLVGVVFAMTVWLLVAIHVRRPLSSMAQVMSSVIGGNLGVRYAPKSRDEIGLLGDRFNEMVVRLQETDHELRSANAEIMERAERMVTTGEMASRLAHEIRNPLAGIESFLAVLAEEASAEDPERPLYEEAIDQIHRIDRTLTDMLSFARPRRLEFAIQSVDDLLQGLVRFCKQPSLVGPHKIVYICAEDLPESYIDKNLLGQAFLNVILNGLQIMSKPGCLSIKATPAPDGGAEVTVRDTGPGIPDDVMPRIFDAFYTTRSRGTGLGLAITRSVVVRHGGTLEVAHTGPEGTMFRFLLPSISVAQKAQSDAEALVGPN